VVRIDPTGESSADPMVVVGETLGNRVDYGSLAPMATRTHRPVYVLDQRGLGHSAPDLSCPEVRAVTPTLLGLGQSDPRHRDVLLEAVAACRARLVDEGVDLSAFTVSQSAADVADLRLALELDEVNLIGTGSAARIALETVREHPEGIRTVVLDSPGLPGLDDLSRAVTRTEQVLAVAGPACAAAGACQAAAADLAGSLRLAVARLDDMPAKVTVGLSASAGPTEVVLDGALLLRVVRGLLSGSGGRNVHELPGLIAQVLTGGQLVLSPAAIGLLQTDEGMCLGYVPLCEGRFVHGLYYSLLCQDLERGTTAPAAPPADLPDGYLTAYLPHPYADICETWDVGQVDPETAEGVRSDVPMLVEIGRYDPYTTRDEVEQAFADVPNTHVVVVPNHGYNVFGFYECPRVIRVAWLDAPTAAPSDTACLSTDIDDPFR